MIFLGLKCLAPWALLSCPWLQGRLWPLFPPLDLSPFFYFGSPGSRALLGFLSPSRQQSRVLEPQSPRQVRSTYCWTCFLSRFLLTLHVWFIHRRGSNDRGWWAVAHMHTFLQPPGRRSAVTIGNMSDGQKYPNPATSILKHKPVLQFSKSHSIILLKVENMKANYYVKASVPASVLVTLCP